MSKQVWICEKCQSLWEDEEAAKACELRHKEPISVKGMTWPKYKFNQDQFFPERVRVEIDAPSDWDWNYAVYKLDYIGPRGV